MKTPKNLLGYKLFFCGVLAVLVFSCQSKQEKIEQLITGTWQMTPHPKPPIERFPARLYDEMIAVNSPIITFTKDHKYIDSTWFEHDESFEKLYGNITWKLDREASYLTFIHRKNKETQKFKIAIINPDSLLLFQEKQEKYLLFIKDITHYKIPKDDGLSIMLPPKREDNALEEIKMKDRNVFKVLINSKNKLLVEEEPCIIANLKAKTKKFIANRGKDKEMSDSPQKASISFKTDTGLKYDVYLRVIDELKAAYHELRAEYLGISLDSYLTFDEQSALKDSVLINKVNLFSKYAKESYTIKEYLNFKDAYKDNPDRFLAFQKARNSSQLLFIEKYYDAIKEYPIRISEAEPTKIGE